MNIDWYLDPIIHQYADFTGRATRRQFWMYSLYGLLFGIVLGILSAISGSNMVIWFVLLGLLIPNVAISVRRLHDINKSGWWLLLYAIPIVGPIIIIIWLATKGDEGANRFGEAGGGYTPSPAPTTSTATSPDTTTPQG